MMTEVGNNVIWRRVFEQNPQDKHK